MNEQQNQDTAFRCNKAEHCPLFIDLNGSCGGLVKKLKQKYCLKDNSCCARYYLGQIIGAKNVPVSMLPHQWEWANQILKDAGKIAQIRDLQDMPPLKHLIV